MAVTANVTIRATEQCWAYCVEGQFDSAGRLMDDSFVHDDRRQALTNVITGRDGTLDNNRVVTEMGFAPKFEPLLVNGERLALVRATFRDLIGNEVVSLQVLETNNEGLRTCCVSFDPDDLDRATDEFHRRSRT
jgi:hypothetical protein